MKQITDFEELTAPQMFTFFTDYILNGNIIYRVILLLYFSFHAAARKHAIR